MLFVFVVSLAVGPKGGGSEKMKYPCYEWPRLKHDEVSVSNEFKWTPPTFEE